MKFRRKTYKLGEIIDLYDNLRIPLSSMEREGREKKYPYYGANGIIDYVDDYIFDGEYILLAEDGTVFIEDKYPVLHLTQGKFWVNNHAHVFKSKNEIANQNFLYYILKNTNIRAYVTGAVQLKINQRNLKKIKVTIPNLEVQKAIANILSSFDDKIEVNNKINKNLEELAQTLYKHWFVDFEFPNEEGKPYKSSGGKMIESELGLIPENWTIQYLNEVLEFERGIEPGSKNYEETYKEHLVPFYRVGDMINQDKVVYVDKELTNNKIANVGDVFVSFDGALGRISNTLNGSYSTGIRKVFSKEKFLSNNFIYVLFQSADIQNTIKMYASGTTILHASSSIQYLSMPFNKDIVDKFTETISPIVDKIITNKIENIKLAEMRDLLLPKLMSGEIRLPIEE